LRNHWPTEAHRLDIVAVWVVHRPGRGRPWWVTFTTMAFGHSGSAPRGGCRDRVERDTKARACVREPPARLGPRRPVQTDSTYLPRVSAASGRLGTMQSHPSRGSTPPSSSAFGLDDSERRRDWQSLSLRFGRGSRGRAQTMCRSVAPFATPCSSLSTHSRRTRALPHFIESPAMSQIRGNSVLALQAAFSMNECITPY
jgi:hypothetical protein